MTTKPQKRMSKATIKKMYVDAQRVHSEGRLGNICPDCETEGSIVGDLPPWPDPHRVSCKACRMTWAVHKQDVREVRKGLGLQI